jgi:[protein-PII] uridylyltransferase
LGYPTELGQKLSEVNGDEGVASRASLLEAAKGFCAEEKDALRRTHLGGAGGAAVVAGYTSLVDAIVTSTYAAAGEAGEGKGHHALVALGGYGRGELCFCSDLDIMLLHDGSLDEGLQEINAFLLHFLWDLGFQVGHSIRSIDEALRLSAGNNIALTSMLESRLLAGEKSTFEEFTDRLRDHVRSGGIKRFVGLIKRERARNRREAGDEVYHSAPNIKRTAGGLRDYHAGIWISLARFGIRSPRKLFRADLITEAQFLRLEKALDFLWRTRNQIYLDGGARDDVLTHRRQESIAREFGYRDARGVLAVELFMQDYYMHASELHEFYKEMLHLGGLSESRKAVSVVPRGGKTERGLRIAHRQVYLPAKDADWFARNPHRLLEVIWYSQKHGFSLSEGATSDIKANLELINAQFRKDPLARDYFFAILSDPLRAGASVRLMNDLGILDRYLPEFAAIRNIIRYHQFHQHPVNEHTLRALENVASIPHLEELESHVLKKVLSEIEAPEILSLSILLHDLGKTREEEHIEAGVQTAKIVGKRLGLDDEQMDTLIFLIRNHTEMSHISRYRDLDEPETVRAFASKVGSMKNLNMLYVLTFADLRAVRQGAWSGWMSALLYRLYDGARRMLISPSDLEAEALDYRDTPKAVAVCEYLRNGELSVVEEHLAGMPPRYLACFSPKEIAEHIRMAASLDRQRSALKWAPVPEYSLSQITVCTKDKPGLFAEIVGAFASQQVSILDAAVFTRSDGIAIDSFHVVDGKTEGPLTSTKWAIVKRVMRAALGGERTVERMIRRAERSPIEAQKTMSSLRRGVSLDNIASATSTIIDVKAPDRIGLLYDIASTIFDLGLDISVARIATDERQARDAFYVSDREGGKITDALRLEEIRRRIEEALDTGPQVADRPGENSTV